MKILKKDISPIPKVINLKSKEDVKNYKSKIALMKKAAKDKLFLEDMKEVMEDFKYVDSEFIE